MADAHNQQIEGNYKAFKAMSFPDKQTGMFALMRDAKVVKVLDSRMEAHKLGVRLYKDKLYSIQEINRPMAYLGSGAYALR